MEAKQGNYKYNDLIVDSHNKIKTIQEIVQLESGRKNINEETTFKY